MELIELTNKKEYETFVENHPKSHFLQSTTWGEFERKTTSFIPHYLGLKENNKLLAVTLLLEKPLPLGYCYYYAPRGYIIDFKDKNLLKTFTEELKKYAKKNKGIFIKIDPDIKLQTLDPNGVIQEDKENNFALVEELKNLGYKHLGFNKNFENSEPRYTFRLDLTKPLEEINNNFHPTTKKILKRGNIHEFILEKNENASIDDFYLTMMETSKREHVLYHDKEYYKEFYEILNKNNMSDLYVVKVNVSKLKKIYQEKINDLEENIKTLEEKEDIKNKNKKQELINQLTKAKKELDSIKKIKEKELVLSSILTAKYKNKVWTVHGGNNSLLRELNANYYIYYEIIKDAKQEGYEIIDFFGTTGDTNKDNPIYGIHLFKKRLGGEYTEFIGEFDLVTNKLMYFLFTKLIPFYRKLKRNKEVKKGENS